MLHALLTFLAHWLVQLLVVGRVLLRPHRDPAARVAWVAVIALLPVGGVALYLLLGEVNPGRKRLRRMWRAARGMPAYEGTTVAPVPEEWEGLFEAGRVLSGFPVERGNGIRLMRDSYAVVDALVVDIDRAEEHVHLLFYIWLPDGNGTLVAEAVRRAARRGVVCRVMVDGMGSRGLLRSKLWRAMAADGVRTAVAGRVRHPLLQLFGGRVDMRNHRKIAVVDGRVTYCGSQNCADPEFLVKAKYAPWVDAVVRIEGAAARQNGYLFARDWAGVTGEEVKVKGEEEVEEAVGDAGAYVQVVASGPTFPVRAMPDLFVQLLHSARREAVITTPYYVPDDTLQYALCACARRGVATTLMVPARNDSRLVAAASRSYYAELLEAGVRIYEFTAGLLHAKTFVVDGTVTLLGSANMDRRSFELNQENNVLICDAATAAMVRGRQEEYLQQCREVTAEEVEAWSLRRRLWNNAMAMMGPLL